MQTKKLETINFAWNDLQGDHLPATLPDTLLAIEGIIEIDLKYNRLGAKGAEVLAAYTKQSTSLKVLDLVKNLIPASGGQMIAEALKENKSLHTLKLGQNDIGDDGIIALAEGLEHNSTLAYLLVEKNDIKLKGAEAMATCLVEHNKDLVGLDLQENEIGDWGGQCFAKVIRESGSIKRLDVRNNQMTDDGVQWLADACQDAKVLVSPESTIGTVLELDLCMNDISEEMHETLNKVAEAQPQLALYHEVSTTPMESGEGMEFEEACSPPDDMEGRSPMPACLERMLGLEEDKDDIAFDNACWYLNSNPELADELWRIALVSGEGPKVNCLEIIRHVVQQTCAGQVLIGLELSGLPLAIQVTYKHLPDIVDMLRAPPPENASMTTTFGTIPERFGLLRTRAVDLIADLIETRNTTICQEIAALDAMPIILDKFFQYHWNSGLHSSVLRMVECIFDVEDAGTAMAKLQQRLLEPPCNLLARLMNAYETNVPEGVKVVKRQMTLAQEQADDLDPESALIEQKLVAASKQVGYMSCVMEMALCAKQAWQYSLAARQLMDACCEAEGQDGNDSAWTVFCAEVLERVSDVSPEKRCLGGEKPRHNPTCGQM